MLFLKSKKNTLFINNSKSIHSTSFNFYPADEPSILRLSDSQDEFIQGFSDQSITVIREISTASQSISSSATEINESATEMNDRIMNLTQRLDNLNSTDDTNISTKVSQLKILTENCEINTKKILEHLDLKKEQSIITNVSFKDSDEGNVVFKSCEKLINYIKNNSSNKLPLINNPGVLDKETIDGFNSLEENSNVITSYLNSIKNSPNDVLSTDILKEVSKPVVDSLLHYSFYNNSRFRSFIESNMNSVENSIDLFPTIFTYVIQCYGHVSYQSFCTTLLTSIGLFTSTPNFIENISVHTSYIEEVEQNKDQVSKRLEDKLNEHNKSLEELENKKLFYSTNLLIKYSLGFISSYSKPIIAGVSFISIFGLFYKNPQLVLDFKQTLFTLSGYDLSSVDKKAILSDSNAFDKNPSNFVQLETKSPETGFTHPVRRLDRTYLFFRAAAIKFFGNPDR